MRRSHDLLAKDANDWRSSVTSGTIFRFHRKMEELLIACPKFGDCLLSTPWFAVRRQHQAVIAASSTSFLARRPLTKFLRQISLKKAATG
jgi:hypothetical protein